MQIEWAHGFGMADERWMLFIYFALHFNFYSFRWPAAAGVSSQSGRLAVIFLSLVRLIMKLAKPERS